MPLLPERLVRALGRVAADAAWRARGAGVRRLEANLRRVLGPAAGEGEARALARAAMRSYVRYWLDVFLLPALPPEQVLARARAAGEVAAYRAAVERGGGFIAALPHMGNWDHAGAWSCLQGGLVVTVAERLRPEALFERFAAYRRTLGMEVLPLSGSGGLLETLAARLRAGRVVCLLADRDLGGTGVDVEFFGARARMPGGPALLALRTGAPLHPVTVSYDAAGVVICFHPRVAPPASGTTRERVAAMTQQVACAFEEAVREHPEDWHALQPVWVEP